MWEFGDRAGIDHRGGTRGVQTQKTGVFGGDGTMSGGMQGLADLPRQAQHQDKRQFVS